MHGNAGGRLIRTNIMTSVADLVSPDQLARLGSPANRGLGADIKAEGSVQLLEVGSRKVTASVGGTPSTSRRKVELWATADDLMWSCTCTRTDLFCKHRVAVALAVWERSSER